jgi:hypothetical protein
VTIFEGNLIAFEDFYFARGDPIKFYFADVAADLHAVGAGVHSKRAPDGAGNADEAFHAAEVVLGTVGDHAAEIGCGVNVCKISMEYNVRLGTRELEDDPGEFAVAYEKV